MKYVVYNYIIIQEIWKNSFYTLQTATNSDKNTGYLKSKGTFIY